MKDPFVDVNVNDVTFPAAGGVASCAKYVFASSASASALRAPCASSGMSGEVHDSRESRAASRSASPAHEVRSETPRLVRERDGP